MPISHCAKQTQISRAKAKFKFLGKFMAKAIMDSRMVSTLSRWVLLILVEFIEINKMSLSYLQLDLPFSIPFYRWLLYEDSALGLADLSSVAPEVQTTLKRLQEIVSERDEITANATLDQETKNAKVSRVA